MLRLSTFEQMKICLVEERDGNRLNEKTFERNEVRVGRDPETCEIVFEQAVFPMVSRRHAELREKNGDCFLIDSNSSFGTYVDGNRVREPIKLQVNSKIQFGSNGPILAVRSLEIRENAEALDKLVNHLTSETIEPVQSVKPNYTAINPFVNPAANQITNQAATRAAANSGVLPGTLVGAKTNSADKKSQPSHANAQLLLQLNFNGKSELCIGRAAENDIRLEGLQISKRHAKLHKTSNGSIHVEDANSTNGVYFQGKRIIGKQLLTESDTVQIGAFQIRVDASGAVYVFDTRSKTRIDALRITKTVKNNSGAGDIKLLDDVSLAILPNEFVGLLGPSGAGKSTLMDALNGMRPPTAGMVFFNDLDFYQQLDALKQSIGYVPQEDVIHRELTVYQTLFYIAKLRLSGDASRVEIQTIISEVLDLTGLTERRDVRLKDLSGGQRKRVSIAVELITKPSVIYLDEPTSGLDPATEDRIMKLFRRIAESGRTIILTTHAMENVRLFDKIVILMRGKLVFYGTPSEALKHIGARDFKELYDKLEEPIEQRLAAATTASANQLKEQRQQITEAVADTWKTKFQQTEQFRRNVAEPLAQLEQKPDTKKRHPTRRLGVFGWIRQTATLTRRYAAVLRGDKLNLAILLVQPLVIALMLLLVMTAKLPRDFIYFVLALVAVWFGTSVASREIVRERLVFKRERMVNLKLFPYLISKLVVLGFIVGLQCALLFLPLKFFDVIGLLKMPGELFGAPQFITMILTGFVGIGLGLLISALVKTSEMATSLVPLVLIPQILFSGLVGVPDGAARAVSLTMPAAWSFDSMKRFSGLDTLEADGSNPNGVNDGLGLYKAVERRNDEMVDETKEMVDEYKRQMRDFVADVKQGIKTDEPDAPEIKAAEKLPENLSDYVGFWHPWMQRGVNEVVLLGMFSALFLATLFVLRRADIR